MDRFVTLFQSVRPGTKADEMELRKMHSGMWILRSCLYEEHRKGTALDQNPSLENEAALEIADEIYNSFHGWFS